MEISRRPDRPHLRFLAVAASGAGERHCLAAARALIERGRRLRQRLVSALSYPAFMLVLVAGLIAAARPHHLPGFDPEIVGMLLARTRAAVALTIGVFVGTALVPTLIRRRAGRQAGTASHSAKGRVARAREKWICAAATESLITAGLLPLDALRIAASITRDAGTVFAVREAVWCAESGMAAGDNGRRRSRGPHRMLAACDAGAAPRDAAGAWERESWAHFEMACDRTEQLAEPVAVGVAGTVVLVVVLGFVRPLVAHYLEALA